MTLNRKLIILICGLALFSSPLYAEFQKTGTTGFVFLEIPVTPRYTALGEVGITLPNAGSEGLFINPALIAGHSRRQDLLFTYSQWYVDISQQALAYTYHHPIMGTFGIQALYFDYGSMEKTVNPTANQTGSYISLGTFSANSMLVGLSFGRHLTDKFAFGSSIKYAREKIDHYDTDNFMVDIGFLYYTGFHSLRIGAFLQNFGLETKYAIEKFKMPQLLKLGLSAEVWGELADPYHATVLIEAVHPNDADERIHVGSEWLLADILALRAGYKFGYQNEGFTTGFGLRWNLSGHYLYADFSWMNHEYLENTLRYSLRWEF